ncbi:MAG: MltA domain-containing protein, partial [Phenylobacterium sp.]
MTLRPAGAALAALLLAACAAAYPVERPGPHPGPSPFPAEPRPPEPAPQRTLPLSALPGWGAEDHAAALAAFRDGCGVARDPGLGRVCREARAAGPLGPGDARAFLETHFRAERSPPAGVLTAYFAPVYEARRQASDEFSAPVRARPAGDATLDRGQIEATPPDGALAWMRPEDLFFLQIQGSGVLTFDDGRRMKAVYVANNGYPFMPIANPMRDRGLLARDNTSGEAIRAWLRDHRGPDAQEVMRLNPRYVFFRLTPDDGRQPV